MLGGQTATKPSRISTMLKCDTPAFSEKDRLQIMKILSAEQIRQWDAYTIHHEPISSVDLMERAASECTRWIIEQKLTQQSIKIFCGKGNNGGDGLAIGRQLAEQQIISEVYILESGAAASDDFEANLSRLNAYPVQKHAIQQQDTFPLIQPTDVVVDCLFGSGLNRPLEGLSAQIVEHINKVNANIISIDLPSGMFADKSSIPHPIIKAQHTLTFQTLKLCFLLPENEDYVGEVHILNIGLHPGFLKTIDASYELSGLELIRQLYRPRKKFSHKGTYGHTLVIAGEKGKMGAAVLCTKACLRSGSGLVSCLVPHDEFFIIQTTAPEAMAASRNMFSLLDLSRYSSMAIGPGIGTGEESVNALRDLLTNYTKPIVIDADGLNILSQNEDLLNVVPKNSILTPHPREFERLFGRTTDNFERLNIAKRYAAQLQVYIIVKGAYSLLVCPDGKVHFNNTGNPGMATGGSGDVLTGILAGLLSQGYSSRDTCIIGMYLHGLAGDLAAQALSREALIAGDLIDYLGKAFLQVSEQR